MASVADTALNHHSLTHSLQPVVPTVIARPPTPERRRHLDLLQKIIDRVDSGMTAMEGLMDRMAETHDNTVVGELPSQC